MGNSEVGHMNLGAGAVVKQDLMRIDEAAADGSIAKTDAIHRALTGPDGGGQSGRRVHLVGHRPEVGPLDVPGQAHDPLHVVAVDLAGRGERRRDRRAERGGDRRRGQRIGDQRRRPGRLGASDVTLDEDRVGAV